MDSTDPDLTQREVADLLWQVTERAGLRVALIGGQAVNFWALPRFTQDFDLTVAANPDAIWQIVRELGAEGYEVARQEDAQSASGPAHVRLVRAGSAFAIDLITAKTDYQDL